MDERPNQNTHESAHSVMTGGKISWVGFEAAQTGQYSDCAG